MFKSSVNMGKGLLDRGWLRGEPEKMLPSDMALPGPWILVVPSPCRGASAALALAISFALSPIRNTPRDFTSLSVRLASICRAQG